MKLLPGFGGTRLVLDASFTSGFDEWAALAAGLAWLATLLVVVAFILSSVRHA
jgi:hypothetical protein